MHKGSVDIVGQEHNSDDRDSSDHRKDRDLEGVLRDLGAGPRGGGGGRGASFFLRNGDTTVVVRCDPGDSMPACVDATLVLLDKAKAAGTTTTPGTPPPAR